MLDKQTAAARIRRELVACERSTDEALRDQVRLLDTLLTTRLDNDVPVGTGHSSMMRLSKTIERMVASRGDVARVHGEMLELGREERLGVDHNGDCPNEANPFRTAELRTA